MNPSILLKRPKHCFVPGCGNSTRKYPNKIFFVVPTNKTERDKWFKVARKDLPSTVSHQQRMFCCEDHFDVETDMQNYTRYVNYSNLGFPAKARLKPGVIPHKFQCQTMKLLTFRPQCYADKKNQNKELTTYENEEASCQNTSEYTLEEIVITETLPLESLGIKEQSLLQSELPLSEGEEKLANEKNIQIIDVTPVLPNTDCQSDENKKQSPPEESTSDATVSKNLTLSSQTLPDPLCSSSGTNMVSAGDSTHVTSSGCFGRIPPEENVGSQISREHRMELGRNPAFYVGIPPKSYRFLQNMSTVTQYSVRDILLTLKKLKLNQPFILLGDDFGIPSGLAHKIFYNVLFSLAAELRALIYWPSRDAIAKNMPIIFRRKYSKVVGLIDCFEVEIEKPSKPLDHALTWSESKKANTIKFMIASTPHGFLTFASKGYCGAITDTDLSENCGFIGTIPEGGEIIVDRGFELLDRTLGNDKLVRPPSVTSSEKLSEESSLAKMKIGILRTKFKQTIRRVQKFQYLAPGTVIDLKRAHTLNAAVVVVCALCNLNDPFFL